MTPDQRPSPAETSGGQEASVVVNAERPVLGASWVVSGRLRLHREIETHTRTIEVTVRREVLTVDYDDAFAPADGGASLIAPDPTDAPPVDRAPVVVVLREEIPQVTLLTVPYEVATARVSRVVTGQTVHTQLSHDEVVLDTTRGIRVPSGLGHPDESTATPQPEDRHIS